MTKTQAMKLARQRAKAGSHNSQVVYLDYRDDQSVEHFGVISYPAYLLTEIVAEHSVEMIVEYIPGQGFCYEK